VVVTETGDQTYVAKTAGSVTPAAFALLEDVRFCDASDIVYSLTTTPMSNFFWMNSAKRKITWSSAIDCQVYTLVLTGTVTTMATPSSYSVSSAILLSCDQSSQDNTTLPT
jgi:hypothetical protein